VEEGIHEHVGGKAKLPAVMKSLWCYFFQLRSMCLWPIPSYFTEYGGKGSRPFGKRKRPSIKSLWYHSPTHLLDSHSSDLIKCEGHKIPGGCGTPRRELLVYL
jgi:hypothetical protein